MGLYTPSERLRRDASVWTLVQGILAPVQFLIFLVSQIGRRLRKPFTSSRRIGGSGNTHFFDQSEGGSGKTVHSQGRVKIHRLADKPLSALAPDALAY